MLNKLVKKAYLNPHLRGELLPIIKKAMEFPSEEALKQYLKDHPGADPKNHSVEKSDSSSSGGVKESKDGFHLSLGNVDPKQFKEAMTKAFEEKSQNLKKTLKSGSDIDVESLKKQSQKTMNSLSSMPVGNKISTEMKQAVSAHKKVQNDKYHTKIANVALAALGVFEIAKGGGVVSEVLKQGLLIGIIHIANKHREKTFDRKAKEEGWERDDNFSNVTYDIIRNKVTPKEINDKYESKVDDITKKLQSKDLDVVDALEELDKLEKKYKKDALPHIEKALDDIGFQKNEDGSFKSKDEEEYANSLLKTSADANNIVLAILIDDLKNELRNNIIIEDLLSDKNYLVNEMQGVMTGKTPIPKAEFEEINKQQRAMKKVSNHVKQTC